MTLNFKIISRDGKAPEEGVNEVYLKLDRWNDHSFVTQFYMTLHDSSGEYHEIGNIKIGFKGQTREIPTRERLPDEFAELAGNFFSLGGSSGFYKSIADLGQYGLSIVSKLNDVANRPEMIDEIRNEEVFSVSLLRNKSLSIVKGQYHRILQGGSELTDYQFRFDRPETSDLGPLSLPFAVDVGSKPSTNIHAIIGRNGVGKTTLLNGMIGAITKPHHSAAKFVETGRLFERNIDESYFSSLISVSFSAFDPFIPPPDQPDPAKGTCYFYIGLKDAKNRGFHRDTQSLHKDCAQSLSHCFSDHKKAQRWRNAIEKLGFEENFASMALQHLEDAYHEVKDQAKFQPDSDSFRALYHARIADFLESMSSGHAIVLITITRLVETVDEKALVLLDEPESHLHPPLLSAFIRALSELLLDRNGLAIVATHSPVVLQELPRSSVWKIYRQGKDARVDRPSIETFAENVGVLTSEVFGLEVERSGFHDLLKSEVEAGLSYKEVLDAYSGQLGFEGRAMLKAMIANKSREAHHDEAE